MIATMDKSHDKIVASKNTTDNFDQIPYYKAVNRYTSVTHLSKTGEMHGVKRVLIFCLMTAVFPTILIVTPLYLRHNVFADVTYEVTESDVVAIEDGLSTIFCESHSLQMNSTFNAFQLKGAPKLSTKRRHIRLKKSMTLPDDSLEYWGFFLLKGALVNLKVCSRYEGSRILVVRGEKNLKTCGLLEHNLKKYGTKFDEEHNRVKVTFENAAVIEIIEDKLVDKNTAAEDFSDDIDGELAGGSIHKNNAHIVDDRSLQDLGNKTYSRHHKRHVKSRLLHQSHKLKQLLENDEEIRKIRAISPFDGKIRHGGNAHNTSTYLDKDSSASSFEMDLLACYNGQILLTQEFHPSEQCNDIHYLEKGKHMVTVHEVATDGYYYYIFYSDNDLFSNDINAVFDIYKPTYHYANQSNGNDCINKTKCTFPISFLSDETVVVEVPTRDGIEHEGDDITYLVSTCHPRMAVYAVFPIAVLFLILGCAFL